MSMDKFIILPSNDDLNRGDQALVWETVRIAKETGYNGDFFILADSTKAEQSKEYGLHVIDPILKHPGRKSRKRDNTKYTIKIMIKWGIVAFVDFIKSFLILHSLTHRLGVLFLSKKEKDTLNNIKESKACFVKGGGFIHSYGRITDPYTIYFSLYHIALALKLDKKVFVMPNSFGPFEGFAVKKMVRKVLSQCDMVAARESISSDMLNHIKVDNLAFPDLGFFLEKNDKTVTAIDELRRRYPDYKLVGITARPYRFPESNEASAKYSEYVTSLAGFCEWLWKNHCYPVFVEQTRSTNTHESDIIAIQDITALLPDDQYIIISDSRYTCRDVKNIYSKLDFLVGTRFHSVIFSLAEGVPSIAITYGGNKGQGIMSDIGLPEYAIPINQVNLTVLIEKFTILRKHSTVYMGKVHEYMKQAYEKRNEFVMLIKSYRQ